MAAEQPQVPKFADRCMAGFRRDHVGRIPLPGIGRDRQALNVHIDLAHLEAGRFEAELEVEDRQFLQLLRE
jgi:hypothetical protein